MDKVDLEIIKILADNGRITHEELGKRLHLSRPAVHQRVDKLQREGVIKGYRAVIDWGKTGQTAKCIIFIKISALNINNFAVKINEMEIPGVVVEECHRLAGEWCLVLKVRAGSPEEITALIDQIWLIEGVRETSTTFILSTILW